MPWGCVDLNEEASFLMSVFEGTPSRVLDVGVGFGSFGMAYRAVQLRMGTLVDKENWESHDDLMNRERRLAEALEEKGRVEAALEKHGFKAIKHQSFVGTGYFDTIQNIVQQGNSSTVALADSTEAHQFTK